MFANVLVYYIYIHNKKDERRGQCLLLSNKNSYEILLYSMDYESCIVETTFILKVKQRQTECKHVCIMGPGKFNCEISETLPF